MRPKCVEELYRRAVTSLVHRKHAIACLEELRSKGRLAYTYGWNHVGIIGALSALGAVLDDYTFELLTYRKPSMWLRERRVSEETVILYDLKHRPLTFANYDYETGRLLIAPHGLDPVLYGVRGEEPDVLLRALDEIDAGEEPSHWMIYRTNQATNAHLTRKTLKEVRPYDNVAVQGRLCSVRVIGGGHVIGRLCSNNESITVAFYRETGGLRRAAIRLADSLVEVGGQVKPHQSTLTLNAEYIRDPCSGKLYTPPLSAYHHLMKPPERNLYGKPKKLASPHKLHMPEEILID